MRQYVIPSLPNYVLRDARTEYSVADIDAKRRAAVEEIAETFAFFFGADSPAIAALREKGPELFMWIKKSDGAVQEISQSFNVDERTAEGIYKLFTAGEYFGTKKLGSLFYMRSAQDAARATEDMVHMDKEHVRVLLVDSSYLITHQELISIGGIEGANLTTSEVLAPVMQRNMPAFVLVHNHPSGDSTPTEADLEFTARVKEAAKVMDRAFLDHVIVSTGGTRSCLDVLESKSVDKGE
ncbi:hypothetical protein BH11PAT4_BH11PAT4_8690 [soil metagenome]